ncbi:MAG: hypothetical protein FJX76_24015 [Armatimonadetes bacterium]|nr:hypothetical protein [Armatimonadota bacterium]
MRTAVLAFLVLILAAPLAAAPPPKKSPPRSKPGSGPQLVLQNGHTQSVTAVAFSPDGLFVATASEDDTAKVWDVQSGRVQGTLIGHADVQDGIPYAANVTGVAFTPDGRRVLTSSWDQTVRVWDIGTGREVAKLSGHNGRVLDVAVSPDGRYAASGAEDKTARLWDLTSGQQVRSYTLPGDGYAVAFSPDGGTLAVGTDDRLAILFPVTGGEPRKLKSAGGRVGALAFSPDGKRMALGGWDGTVTLCEVATAREIARATLSQYGLSKFAFSPDGKVLACAGGSGIIYLVNPSDLKEMAKLQAEEVLITSVAFAGNGQLAAGLTSRRAAVWDVAAARQVASLEGRSSRIYSLAISPDGLTLATAGRDGTAKLWDLAAGKLAQRVGWHVVATATAFSPDGRLLVGGAYDGRMKAWELKTGRETWSIDGHYAGRSDEGEVHDIAFSPDGKTMATASSDTTVRLWDTASGRLRGTLKGHTSGVSGVAFSPDGKILASASYDGTVRQWDVASKQCTVTRKVEQRRTGYRRALNAAFSPDGKWLAAGTYEGTANVWEVEFEESPRIFTATIPRYAWSIAWSPDSRILALGVDRKVILFDADSGKTIREIEAHEGGVTDIEFLRGGGILASAGLDTAVKFWDVASGRLLATALDLDDGKEWVVTTPDGLFDGSPRGQSILEWRIGDKTYALEQFFNAYYTPGVLSRVIHARRKPETLRAHLDMSSVRPPPRVSIVTPPSGSRSSENPITVTVTMEDQGGGVSSPRLYLNGHRVSKSQQTEATPLSAAWRVSLERGKNQLRATAFNKTGEVESRGDEARVISDAGGGRHPILHVLAVGIDGYKSGLRLNFARADAQSMASFFKPGLFNDVKSTVLVNEKATRDGILNALHAIRKEAIPQDTLLVYFAGHGTLLGDVFYFLPFDARVATDNALRASALSSVALGDALSDIPATKQIVVLDACHSGASTTALGRLVASRDAVQLIRAQQRLARSSGTFLVAAATAEQYAKEFPELGHGVLTYAILRALGEKGKPGAEVNSARQVTVNALLRYLSEQVPTLTERFHGGRQDVVQFSTGQDFPLVVSP